MLKKRMLTAVILIPIFLLILFTASPQWFGALTGIVVLLCAWEWSALMGVKKFPQNLFYPFIMLFVLFAAMWLRIPQVMYVGSIWWIFAFFLIILYPKASDLWGSGVIIRGLMGGFVLIPCWLALNLIRNADNGTYILLLLFILIWGADTGAYFVGKYIGKHKMAPLISPGKTWEGLFGALVTTIAIVLVALWKIQVPYHTWIGGVAIGVITVLFSIVGDLFESMLKRKAGIKDSSNLLPGHGGILDRIDSLTAAAPIFVWCSVSLEKIFS